MARQEQDREDLLAEATALVERVELVLLESRERLVAGFRRGGELSLFWDVDPVLQFNATGELRRAFIGGLLYKAERGRLASLTRQRNANATVLERHDLTDTETAQLLDVAETRLNDLASQLHRHVYQVIGQVPAGANVPERVRTWLINRPLPIAVAKSPRV